MDREKRVKALEKLRDNLPKGYISRKNINGRTYEYYQWTENGKKKSRYLKGEEAEELAEQIDLRREIDRQLKEAASFVREDTEILYQPKYNTSVRTGAALRRMVSGVSGLKKRDVYGRITEYIRGNDFSRICAVYGLRRTGKTTMIFQQIGEMADEDFEKTAYIKARTGDVMRNVTDDLDVLYRQGFRYIFIDEVMLMEDFIDSAALFSDIYAPMGMKIVLSGTDSLGFWFAESNELYDRVHLIHTTFIPYREYSRLLGIDSIDEYIRYGGTLRQGERLSDKTAIMAEDASFRDDESTRKYIDTAISRNIQHSLARFEYGHYFRHLYSLYEAGELTGAINRIIEDMNHRFIISVLTRDFVSSDLGIAARNLRNERDSEKRTDIPDVIDRKAVTKRLMEILDIRNSEERRIGITVDHVLEIRQYLKALDLIADCPVMSGDAGISPDKYVIFTQPGMRYCQAQALVHSLMKDEAFISIDAEKRDFVCERILEEVRGRMLEDIVLLETSKALGRKYEVFKLMFDKGEYDMVIYDESDYSCYIFEIKHSSRALKEQARHLVNGEMLAKTSPRFGRIAGRCVIYLGECFKTGEGITYLNAENFLKALPEFKGMI